ncbi:MAG: hypothetical protein ABSG03_06375 [Bryobacteraceae bacterium]
MSSKIPIVCAPASRASSSDFTRLIVAFAAATLLASAQPAPEVLVHQDFETGATGWFALGAAGGSVGVTHQPGETHSGNSALAFTYEVKRGQPSVAVMPAPPALARMQHLRFWVKTDRETPVAVLLSETQPGGGNYTAWFWSPANAWQQIDLTPADFVLSDGPQDPKDADGKLDLDQLQAIGILDLASFFPAQPATRTLWIDDFEALGGPPPAEDSAMRIDNFDRGFLPWITIGDMDLKLVRADNQADNPLHEPALEASYQQRDNPMPVLLRRIANHDLAKAVRLDFDVASDEETTLVVALEIKRPGASQGPRFTLPIFPPGNREVFHVSVKLEDFQGQGKLDPAQLKTLIVTDPAGAGDSVGTHNRIWIGKVEFRPAM